MRPPPTVRQRRRAPLDLVREPKRTADAGLSWRNYSDLRRVIPHDRPLCRLTLLRCTVKPLRAKLQWRDKNERPLSSRTRTRKMCWGPSGSSSIAICRRRRYSLNANVRSTFRLLVLYRRRQSGRCPRCRKNTVALPALAALLQFVVAQWISAATGFLPSKKEVRRCRETKLRPC